MVKWIQYFPVFHRKNGNNKVLEHNIMLLVLCALFIFGSASAQSICDGHKTVFITALNGTISDGPADYLSNQRCEWLILSPDPVKYPYITLEFLFRLTECAYDYIMVHDGDSYSSPVLATLSGDSTTAKGSPSKVLARSGKMLVYLFSDMNTEFAGFNASFTISECPNNCTGNGHCVNNTCICETAWTATDCSQHACPHNCGAGQKNGHCRTDTELKKCNCEDGHIGQGCHLSIYSDDKEEPWTVVYDYPDELGSVGRAGHTGIYLDPYFYIFGGFDGNKPLAELLRYDFQGNEWLHLEHSKSQQPSARFFHSMTTVTGFRYSTHFLLVGGNLGSDQLSNETWMYDTSSNAWRLHVPAELHDRIPAICQHTATLVETKDGQYMYLFGGRMQNSHEFGLSSDMYRFDWTNELWQKMIYDPSGVKASKLRVAGHSMVYDAVDETLILFGGFRMDPQHKAVYSSSVFVYSVKANRWAEIAASDDPESFTYNVEPMAFHSADIIGDYMVVHGGSLLSHNHNLCYSWQTHFYNMRCHSWIKELRKSSEPAPMRSFGHAAAVMNEAVLLIHGGYNGAMSRRLLAFKLPKLNSLVSAEVANMTCEKHDDEELCAADYVHGCVYINWRCKSSENELPTCGSICQYLKDCQSCATFQSYVRNSAYDWESSHCGWCVQDSKCYSVNNNEENLGACVGNASISKQVPWWNASDTKLLQNPDQCLLHNIQPGIIASEYHNTPNFSQPDNVSHLTEVYLAFNDKGLSGDRFVKINGFFRPKKFQQNFLKMKLHSSKGNSAIQLSSNDSPVVLKEIAKNPQTNQLVTSMSGPLALHDFNDERYYIQITYNHTGSDEWTGQVEAEIATSATTVEDDFKFFQLSSTFLEPYQSSVISDENFPSCNALSNCLSCLTDVSCMWCQPRSLCVPKTVAADGSCGAKDSLPYSPHFGMITEPESCVVCRDYSTCYECVMANTHCEWRRSEDSKGEERCVRRGSGGNSTSDPAECPLPCHHRQDCQSCLEKTNQYEIALNCAWCSTTQKCYLFTRYHLTAYSFGQCAFWVDKQENCAVCSEQQACQSCLQTYECGWCSAASNPLLGYCTRGGFTDSEIKCDAEYLPSEYSNNETGEILWNYSSCPDVNECELQEWPKENRLHSCHANATCHNTDGSYICICKDGFEGDGHHCNRTCVTTCEHGKCSGAPFYKCICDLGWTSSLSRVEEDGIECDVDCNCNLLSTCNSGQGTCDSCQHNTTGATCEQCLPGHYHGIGVGTGCHPCQCNGHGVPDMGLCNQTSGECFCQDKTEGVHCEMCNKSGYFGDSRNGGTCYRKCEGRLRLYDDFGAFGSWESAIRQDGSMLRREIENKISTRISVANCEWTLIAQNFTYGKTAIKIILEKNINIPCYTNKVLVFDGDFQSGGMTLLGEFCGSDWENDVTVLSTKGRVTVQYSDVYLEDKQRNSGFTARYEVVTLCENEMWSSDEILSGDGEESRDVTPLITGYYNSSVQSAASGNCQNQFHGLIEGCPNDCSSHLSQGVCKNGYCHCSANFTGFDCSKNKTEFAASISVNEEWNKFLSEGPQPSARIGHALVSIGQSLWLHGGISYNEGPLSDLWRYNTSDRDWTVFSNVEGHPERRFMHAAAKHPSGKRFYIHGGILNGGNTSSDIWLFADDELWHKLDTDSPLPSLAGHTMTFCGGNMAYIIGGYSSTYGFSKNVWTFDATSKVIKFISKSQIHPPMIYGHSAVCDQDTGMIYVFGGMEASLLQLPSPTNSAYVLNTTTLEWQPVFLNGSNPVVPSPRAFHVALNYRSVSTKGMMMIGGQLRSSQTSDEIWFLDYKCRKWIKLASKENIPAYATLASVNGNHYVYGGLQNGRFEDQMIVVSVIGTFHDDLTENCAGDPEAICSYFKDCKNCLEVDSCHWCEPSSDLGKGKCLSFSSSCDADHGAVSDKKECNLCLNLPPSMCNTRPDCSWAYTEVMDKYHDKLLRSCSCHWDSSVIDYVYTTAAQSNVPIWPAIPLICEDCSHECPGSCSVQNSCETCLEFPDSTGVWWYCVWSPGLRKCLDPAYVPLVCPPGGNCGTLASKGKASCPVSRCNELFSCWKCINEPQCYWLQLDSTGLCQDVSEREDSGDSWYYECPAEDECSNHWDDCLNDKTNYEKCLDLPQGYKCECQKGYDRVFSTQPCSPVCTEGCVHGKCIEPDDCSCNFGYAGVNCTVSCQCNGHSDCIDEKRPHICLKCHNNTVGNQCESCKTDFVGDPTKKRPCEKCKDVCHGKSKVCTSTIKNTTSHGPTHDDVRCLNCSGHSWGDQCEKCKEGYFKSKGKCRKCECHGHSDTCDQATGGLCKCQNETMSSEEKCNAPQPNQDHPLDCWKKQCDKCRPMYQGNPRDGGHCYRHVAIEQGMCFSAKSPTLCPTVDYGGPTKNYLPVGETVSFAINPKYTNVDIRIIVDVTYGELSLFLSHLSDSFRIITDKLTYMHKVIPNGGIVNVGRKKRDLTHEMWHSDYLGDRSQDEEVVRMQRSYLLEDDWRVEQDDSRSIFAESPLGSSKLQLDVVNASDINSYVSLRPNTALRVDGIQNRLVVTVPYHGFDLKLTKFFVILLGQRAVQPILHDAAPVTDNLNNKRTIRNVKNQVVDRTAGQLVFRQDQTHIDLFVFFSVFFSCFFLFLAICIVAWKIKQAMDARQAIQEHKIQMQHMASRPFATVYVILDNYIPEPLFYSRKCKRLSDHALPHLAMNSTAMLFQARSCPIFDRHGNQEANNDGPGTSGLNAATLRPSSSSLPTSPTQKTFKTKQNVGIYSRETDNHNLADLTPNLKKGEHASPVMSISKSISQGTCYSYDSTERLLVLHASSDASATKIPLLNSTTTYIKPEPEVENFGQLTPLSSDGSRSPSPFRPRVQTIVSLDESGKIRTFGKRRTLPPVLKDERRDASAERIFEPRIKFRSTPHIPVTQPRNSVTDNISQPIINIKSSMESPRKGESPGSQKQSLLKLPHRVSAKSSIKTDARSTCATGKAIRPLACEITENGFASVNTVLLQLPGGPKAPVLACLGSTLAATHNSCYPSLSNDLHISKPQFKSRYSKVS